MCQTGRPLLRKAQANLDDALRFRWLGKSWETCAVIKMSFQKPGIGSPSSTSPADHFNGTTERNALEEEVPKSEPPKNDTENNEGYSASRRRDA